MKLRLLILCFWLLATDFLHASTLSVRTEPAVLSPGQTFNLILELDENAPAGLPDFGPLGYDFYIQGTSHNASYVYNNGQSKSSTQWRIILLPKHTGQITIPAIQVGKARSTAFTPNLSTDAAHRTHASQPSMDQALFIKTDLSSKNPWLNQQVLYTVKIFHYSSILDAAYQPPNLGDALIVPLGTNKQYQVIEQGRPYLVEEQKYAFFPQKTGSQIIFPPKFQALIYDDVPRRAEAEGTPTTLKIKAIPNHFTPSTWLPAKVLSVQENYNQSDSHLSEGSTLTRTITLKASGLPAELFPPIEPKTNDTFKIYPEQPVRNNAIMGDTVIGNVTIKINYLFNHSGAITIPEQQFVWFNTETQQTSKVTLPAKTFQIIADSSSAPTAPTPLATPTSTTEKPQLQPIQKNPAFLHGLIFHIALFATFLLLSCICILSKKKIAQPNRLRPLKKACRRNHPEAAREALLHWARQTWPNASILNLNDIIQQTTNSTLANALHALSETLYQNKKSVSWEGNTLWLAIQACTKQKKSHASKKSIDNLNHLPPINP
ncbi:MAG: BatD family protein [Legionella sp.]|nr:BatD family protein [Legionella sp.]